MINNNLLKWWIFFYHIYYVHLKYNFLIIPGLGVFLIIIPELNINDVFVNMSSNSPSNNNLDPTPTGQGSPSPSPSNNNNPWGWDKNDPIHYNTFKEESERISAESDSTYPEPINSPSPDPDYMNSPSINSATGQVESTNLPTPQVEAVNSPTGQVESTNSPSSQIQARNNPNLWGDYFRSEDYREEADRTFAEERERIAGEVFTPNPLLSPWPGVETRNSSRDQVESTNSPVLQVETRDTVSPYSVSDSIASERMADKLVRHCTKGLEDTGSFRNSYLDEGFTPKDQEYISSKVLEYASTVSRQRSGRYISEIKGVAPNRLYEGRITKQFIKTVFKRDV